MAHITQVGRIMVSVTDQDAAIASYRDVLGFALAADIPFANGDRWVEVAPSDGGAAIALTRPQGSYQPGRMTRISLGSSDVRGDHDELQSKGVDVDAQLMGGEGGCSPDVFLP